MVIILLAAAVKNKKFNRPVIVQINTRDLLAAGQREKHKKRIILVKCKFINALIRNINIPVKRNCGFDAIIIKHQAVGNFFNREAFYVFGFPDSRFLSAAAGRTK